MILSVVVWFFAAVVVIGAIGFLVLDAMDKVESIQKRAPWIGKLVERRSSFIGLLMICIVLLIGDSYELLTKEIPEAPPPKFVFQGIPPPNVMIVESPRAGASLARTQAGENKKNRLKVAEMLNAGNEIKMHCESLTPVLGIFSTASAWALKTSNELAAIDQSYKARFDAATGPTYIRTIGGKPIPDLNANTWNYVNVRTEALVRILETMPN